MGEKGIPIPEGWAKGEKRPIDTCNTQKALAADTTLSSGAYRVMSMIILSGGDKGFSFDGIKSLVAKCGLKDRIVREHIQTLIKKGYLKEQKRNGTSSIFTFPPMLRELGEAKKKKVRHSSAEGVALQRSWGVAVECRTNNDILLEPFEYSDIEVAINNEQKNIKRSQGKEQPKNQDNELDWILSELPIEQVPKNCRIAEYGPIGYGKENYPILEEDLSLVQVQGLPC